LFKKIAITLTYMRRNHVEAELGEYYGVHQTTISGIVIAYTPVLASALADFVPTADDLDPGEQLIVDGTLLPCWSWAAFPEDYSGKHHTTGQNVQVACSLDGELRWVSDPMPGRTHDANALRCSGLLDVEDGPSHIGDKGYIGLGMITLQRKLPGERLREDQKEFNKAVSQIRYKIERVIANLKTWRIIHTDYRRPHHTHPETISAVIALEFYRMSFS
jgi:transposase